MTLAGVAIATILVWVVYAWVLGRDVRSVSEFLEGRDSLPGGITNWRIYFSTYASYLMVASYLVFYTTYTALWGGWVILFPIFNIVGFFLFALLILSLRNHLEPTSPEPPLFQLFRRTTSRPRLYTSLIRGFALLNVFIITLAMTVETFYTSKVLAVLTAGAPGAMEFVVLLLIASVLEVTFAGVKGVVYTDVFQVLGAVPFLLFAFTDILNAILGSGGPPQASQSAATMSGPTMDLLILFLMNSLLTPYLNLNSWHLNSLPGSVSAGRQSLLAQVFQLPFFRSVVLFNLVTLALFGLLAVAHVSFDWLNVFVVGSEGSPPQLPTSVAIMAIVFSICALISTIDSMLISHFYHFYLSFSGNSARETSVATRSTKPQVAEFAGLQRVKRSLALLYGVAFAVAILLQYYQPNLIHLLLGLGSVVTIAGPLILKLLLLEHWQVPHQNTWPFMSVFGLLVAANAIFVISPSYQHGASVSVSIGFLTMSVILNLVDGVIAFARRGRGDILRQAR